MMTTIRGYFDRARVLFRRAGKPVAVLLACALAAAPAFAEGGGWLDAGAGLPGKGAGTAGSTGFAPSTAPALPPRTAWMDAGAGVQEVRALAQDADAIRWAAWKSEAPFSVDWTSSKLEMHPEADYDTWLVNFAIDGTGVAGVKEYTKGRGGVGELAVFGILRGEDVVYLSRRQSGGRDFSYSYATLEKRDGAWHSRSGADARIYRRAADGGIEIVWEGSKVTEIAAYHPDGTATTTRNGTMTGSGSFSRSGGPGSLVWIERESSDSDGSGQIEFTFTPGPAGGFGLSVGGPEPIASAKFEGIQVLRSGDPLENLAIADLILGYSRRATPVLVWSILGVYPAVAGR